MHMPVTETLTQLPLEGTMECPGDAPAGLVWDGAHFWVLDEASGMLYCVDPQTGSVLNEAPAEEAAGGTAWDGTSLYQAAPGQYRILVVDPASGRTVRRIPTRVKAAGLCWDGRNLWHGSFSEKRIYMLDAGLGEVRGTIDAATLGGGLTWDGQTLWQCDGVGLLTRISTEGAVLARYRVDGAPVDLAWDGRSLWYTCARDRRLKKVGIPD